ncbi:MAG: hypothetical protein HY300_07075 [Verrucomicrobia bacterium]|nr:hypothetical protein [Verrucomicrobiota bacterium]
MPCVANKPPVVARATRSLAWLGAVLVVGAALAAEKDLLRWSTGVIERAEATERKLFLTVNAGKPAEIFVWDGDTSFWDKTAKRAEQGKPITAELLKTGERVQVHYSEKAGQRRALRIIVQPARD